MAKVDWKFLQTTNEILKEGSWDTNLPVRPEWEDGTPAHTVKGFAIMQKYKMCEEFPITTLRQSFWRGPIDEVQWIWQLKSNNIHKLHSHVWDAWADETGSIGKAYGWQVAQVAQHKFGKADQTDTILWYLKNQPAFRSIIGELFKIEDLHEMRLYPCVHHIQLDVAGDELNMFVKQRSNDMVVAGNWNPVQYSALLHMFAQVSGLKPNILAHVVENPHIYDRHIPFIVDMTLSRAKKIEELVEELSRLTPKDGDKYYEGQFIKKALLSTGKTDYSDLIKQAQDLEVDNDKHDTEFYKNYAKEFVQTPQFRKAEFIVDIMIKHPEFEKAFGFCKPQLVLDPNVTNFYDFKSPLTTDKETGKFVANKDSSFKVEDYNWQEEGIKFAVKIPVAE